MTGSQLGLSHVHAAARHHSFVEEAERLRILRVAESARLGSCASPLLRLRIAAGAFLIRAGERVKGSADGDSLAASASSLRLAR